MDGYEERYRVLEALIQQGPLTGTEIENVIRATYGIEFDVTKVLLMLRQSGLVSSPDMRLWRVNTAPYI